VQTESGSMMLEKLQNVIPITDGPCQFLQEGLADETIQCETRRIPAAGTQSVANQARCGLMVK
jgi:hypothetical protein